MLNLNTASAEDLLSLEGIGANEHQPSSNYEMRGLYNFE